MSDYLWDGHGDPDPEVQRLERLLRPLRHDVPLDALPTLRRARRPFVGGFWPVLAAAASLVVAIGGTWVTNRPAWEVTRLEDAPGSVTTKDRLRVGDWLETNATTRARIRVGRIGQVTIEPKTRVGRIDAGRDRHWLSLDRGVMHAMIWAPPGNFFVQTPSATAVDLGCAYTLEVDPSGAGLLRVESGWVGFEFEGRESFVPAGGMCATRPAVGPGTPFFEDASETLKQSLEVLDFGREGTSRDDALTEVLAAARQRDALTLWHLVARLPEAERGRVFDRLVVLVEPPDGVTRDGIVRGERAMLDAWWDALDLGSAGWWRLWKAPWPPRAGKRAIPSPASPTTSR